MKLSSCSQLKYKSLRILVKKKMNMISQDKKNWLIKVTLTIPMRTRINQFSHNTHVCAHIHHQKKNEFGCLLTFFSSQPVKNLITHTIIYRREGAFTNNLDFPGNIKSRSTTVAIPTTICCGWKVHACYIFSWHSGTRLEGHLPGLLEMAASGCSWCNFAH